MTSAMTDSEFRPVDAFRGADSDAGPATGVTALLPPPGTRRWVARRKAQVVNAVRVGALSLEEACARYSLSVEEFLSWQRDLSHHGVSGLRATRVQDYRRRAGSFEQGVRAA